MRRLALVSALLAAFLLVAAAAQAQGIRAKLASAMRLAGPYAGAYVLDATKHRVLYQSRAGVPRMLASNAKLFTSSAILGRLGPDGTFATQVESAGRFDPATGVVAGDVYLHGGGDPTFGTRWFVTRFLGRGATIEALAGSVAAAGVRRIDGRIVGDESRFDSLRWTPASGGGFDPYLGGPLSALTFNHGIASVRSGAAQTNPPLFAARRLAAALSRRGIRISGRSKTGRAPAGVRLLAAVRSPPLAMILRLQNKYSDNFVAEILLKDLAAATGRRGTTRRGAALAAAFARRLGSSVSMNDGSGLSRADRAAPKEVVDLLDGVRSGDPRRFGALLDSLPIAGEDGTLQRRMRGSAARGRCHAKTGTLSGVSALSGYCFSRGGDVIEFSLLMNGVNVLAAHAVQDRMASYMAAFSG